VTGPRARQEGSASPDGKTSPWALPPATFPCALFLLCFPWFASHAVPNLYFGDVGELLAAIHTGGVPHPTGFPLLLLLGFYPSKVGTFQIHLLTSAVAALGVVFACLWAKRWFGRWAFFWTACVLLGSSTLLLHASITRVYPYQFALLAAIGCQVAHYTPLRRWALGLGAGCGISMTTHILTVTALACAVVFLWRDRRQVAAFWPWILTGALLPLSFYLWLPLRAHALPALSWGSPDTLTALTDYLTQKDYALKMFSRDLGGTWLFLKEWARLWANEWNPLLWVLATWGGFTLYRQARSKVLSLLAILLVNVLLLYAYGVDADLYVLYRYFLPSYLAGALLVAAALSNLGGGAPRRLWRPLLLTLVLLALSIPYPAIRWMDLSHSVALHRHLMETLRSLPRSATFIVDGDNMIFPNAYARYVRGLRDDLRFVDWSGKVFPGAKSELRSLGEDASPLTLENHWVAENGSLFLASPRNPDPPYQCQSWGVLFRLSDQRPAPGWIVPPPPDQGPVVFTRSERRDPEAVDVVSAHHLLSASWYAQRGDKDAALRAVSEALSAAPRNANALLNAGLIYWGLGDLKGTEKLLLQALSREPNKVDTLFNLGVLYGKMGRVGEGRALLLRAARQRPGDRATSFFLERLDALERGTLDQASF